MSLGSLFNSLIGQFNNENTNDIVNSLATDPTFTSGLNYARSIAGGQNVPNMIAPGVSYSAERPQGYTQFADNPPADNPPVAGPIAGPTPPPVTGPTPPFGPPANIPPPVDLPGPPMGLPFPIDFDGIGFGGIDFDDLFPLPFPGMGDIPPIDIGGPVGGPIPDPVIPPIDFPIDGPIQVPPPVFIDPPFGGPVDLPGMGGLSMDPVPSKQKDQLFIDDIPRFEDIPSTEYVVPQVPLNNLLNQSPPQGPVGMSPQETAKMSSQQELLNLISNKDILQEIPADDGVRNQYQVELDEYINKSPINMDTYKEELPIGSAINLGIPAVMETVVPMVVPGLGLAQNISNSLQNNNNSSSVSRPSTPSVSRPSVSRPNYSHSQVSKFGR